MTYEYKTIELPFKARFFSRTTLPDIATAINEEARAGWRLVQVCEPIGVGGSTVSMIAVLERPSSV